jgi:hypothetical protein
MDFFNVVVLFLSSSTAHIECGKPQRERGRSGRGEKYFNDSNRVVLETAMARKGRERDREEVASGR